MLAFIVTPCFFLFSYDDDIDEVIHYQRVPLEDLQRIEIGITDSFNILIIISYDWIQGEVQHPSINLPMPF